MDKFIFISLFISLNIFAQSEVLVDPTTPLNFQQKKVIKERKVYRNSLPKLQSLIVKSGKQQAIINNKIYQQGQRVNGYQITLIDAQKVLLEYQHKTYKLTLYSLDEHFSH